MARAHLVVLLPWLLLPGCSAPDPFRGGEFEELRALMPLPYTVKVNPVAYRKPEVPSMPGIRTSTRFAASSGPQSPAGAICPSSR